MRRREIVVIGGSRGAFGVLKVLAAMLPPEFRAIVCIVLHIGRHESVLPELMAGWGPLPVKHPVDGEALSSGTIYIAPPDRHLLVSEGTLRLDSGAAENFARPAVDPLFRTAASAYGERAIGVILSGDLDDGAAGLAAVRAHGGYCIVQDPDDCEAPSMPRTALQAAGADAVAGREKLAERIVAAIEGAPCRVAMEASEMGSPKLDLETSIARQHIVAPEEMDRIGTRSPLTCPECGGMLWRVNDRRQLRYRCHTGHAFGALSLEDGQEKALENTIWAAIRAANERVAFAHERKTWAAREGDLQQLAIEQARIDEAVKLIEMLRQSVSATINPEL
jgi:two-component system, chemotaxis family, protein-glutamate methylesterase/glutaminase